MQTSKIYFFKNTEIESEKDREGEDEREREGACFGILWIVCMCFGILGIVWIVFLSSRKISAFYIGNI